MAHIQVFEPAYAAQVLAAILSIQRDEFGFAISANDQPDLVDIAAFYQTDAGQFWVALSEGAVVGTIALKDIGDGRAALRKMFVLPSARGGGSAGVATRLLETLLDHARHTGLQEILLGTTDRFLAAHRFYEKNEFVRMDEAALPSSFPRMSLDTRFYRRIVR
jgi:N-acetylglutamate synthase-like GNAT family acetyltransferase